MKVFNFLKNAYYRLFFFFFRMNKPNPYGGRETDAYATVLAVLPHTFVLMAGAFAIDDILMRIISSSIIRNYDFPIAFGVVVLIINYVLFFSKKRYKRIKAMFANEEKRTRHWRSFFCIVFCVFSLFGMFIIDIIFGRPQTG